MPDILGTNGYAAHIGRVGALAVALGITGAVGLAPAWADDSTEPASSDTTQQDAAQSGSTDSASRTNAGPRRSAARPTPAATGEPKDIASTLPRSPRGVARGVTGTVDRNNGHSSAGAAAARRAPQVDTSAAAAGGRLGLIPSAALPSVTVTPSPTAAQSPSVSVSVTMPAASAVTQPAVPQQPTSQPVNAFISRVESVLSGLLGSGPGWAPESPLSWGLLAWTRRQPAAAVSRTVALPAQSTSQPLAASAEEGHTGLPEDLERVTLASGLSEPTDFRFLPNGAILITEKNGAIKVFQNNQLQETPLITLNGQTAVERGLSGLAVDPDFATNHYIYVSYTGTDNHQLLSRLTVSGYTGNQSTDVLTAGSETVMYRLSAEAANYHQGGGLTFGPDDKLYWGLGDNFDFGNSQDLTSPNGKILRLDVHTLNLDGTATAPSDNPFVNTPGALPEIYAYGFRNPFRFTFTPGGQLLEGDVGGAAWEELNLVTPGANYGWPLAEGNCVGCGFVNPIYTYAHTAPPTVAGAISSVLVYTGDALGPEYTNQVFIADYALGWMKTLNFDSQFSSFISEAPFDGEAGTTVQLLEGPDGKVYQLTIYPGELSVIQPTGGNRAPTAKITATPSNGLSPLTVNFSAADSSDPEGSQLTYSWDFGDPTTTADVSTDANPTWQYTTNGSYTATLVVSDGEKTNQANQRIVVGSTAPTATVLTPTNNALYKAGDTISFTGQGSDLEDGTLPDSAYKWTVVFHHGDHVHPFADNITGPRGSITIPTDESNVSNTFYRITLTVTDSSGLSTTSSVDVKPRLVNLTFNSSDPDAVYTIDGIPHRGTYTETAVVGVKRVLDVPSPQTTTTGPLIFGAWSQGGTQKQTITTPEANATYTVIFDDGSPHNVPPTGSLGGQLLDNQAANARHLYSAINASATTLWKTAVDVPFDLLNAIPTVTDPSGIPALLTAALRSMANGVAQAITPLIDGLTDIVASTTTRLVGVTAALTANVVPLVLTVVNAPVAIATAVVDGITMFVKYVQAWDALGIQASLKYIPELIGQAITGQTARIVGAVNDLRDDVHAALVIGFPGAAPTDGGDPGADPFAPILLSLQRSAGIAADVGAATGSIGQAALDALRDNLAAVGTAAGGVVGAVTAGQPVWPAGVVAWRSMERQAGAGRRSVHAAIDSAAETFSSQV